MTKLGQMLVDDGYKRGKIQGALLCGKTPEEVAEMFDILLQEVLKVKENEKDILFRKNFTRENSRRNGITENFKVNES